jgi:hypothetical protein
VKQRFSLLVGVLGVGLALASACGDDHPYVPADGGGSNAGSGTLTAFVIDLIENHTDDPTPADYSTFSTLPDPDGTANNTAAYDSLFQ